MLHKINTYLQQKLFNFDLLLALRGVMAISVVFYHFFIDKEIIKSNFAKLFIFALDGSGAVLVFFILSGYLMFKLFVIDRYSFDQLWIFYKARINRILPLYYGVLIIVGLIVFGVFWEKGNKLDFVKLFTFTQYLDGKDFVLEKYRWFSVTWSLIIEMQFYIVMPLLAWLFVKFKNMYLQVLLLCIFAFMAVNDTILQFAINNGILGYFNRSILGYFPFFMVGAMVALLLGFHKNIQKHLSKLTFALPILILVLVCFPAYSRIFIPNFNSNWIFVIVTILIIAVYESFSFDIRPAKWSYNIRDIFNFKKVLEIFGHLSFSIYMWHLFVIQQIGGFVTISNFPLLSNVEFAIVQKSIILITILLVSFCSFKTLEKIKIFKS